MTPGQSTPRLALFDIDGTLVREPSTEKRFTLWMLLGGKIGLLRLLAYAFFCLRYLPQFGLGVLAKNKSLLWRRTVDSAETLAKRWAAIHLKKALYAPCAERMRQHIRRGDTVVLLSGTPDFLARAVAGELSVSSVVATRCATSNGRFRLAPPEVHRVGEEKLSAARELCRRFGSRLANASAYGNSITDLPLLAACGMPVAVNPDEALAIEAARRGWEIMDTQAGDHIRASA